MPVTELYAFNLIYENLLAALYGVALSLSSNIFITSLCTNYSTFCAFVNTFTIKSGCIYIFVGLYIIDKAKIHILSDFVVKKY